MNDWVQHGAMLHAAIQILVLRDPFRLVAINHTALDDALRNGPVNGFARIGLEIGDRSGGVQLSENRCIIGMDARSMMAEIRSDS